MSCKGLHCPGCGDSGGGLAAVVAVVVLGALITQPVIAAAAAVLRVAVDVIEVAAIAAVSAAGLAVIAGAVIIGRRVQRRHAMLDARADPVQVASWTIRPGRRFPARREALPGQGRSLAAPGRHARVYAHPDARTRAETEERTAIRRRTVTALTPVIAVTETPVIAVTLPDLAQCPR